MTALPVARVAPVKDPKGDVVGLATTDDILEQTVGEP